MIKTFTLLFILLVLFTRSKAQLSIQKMLYHEYDKTTLTKESQLEFDSLIKQLQSLDVQAVLLQSHTDKHGSKNYNDELSEARNKKIAFFLKQYLPTKVQFKTGFFGKDSLLTLSEPGQAKNRRTEISIWYKVPVDTANAITIVEPYTEDVIEQRFEINLDDTVFIKAAQGTCLKIPPGAFQSKNYKIATGSATLLIKEYYQPGEILLAGMHSVSDSGLLQTGGMFKLCVVQQNDTMLAQTRLPVEIKIPNINNLKYQMNVFISTHADSALWNDSRQNFQLISPKWSWPDNDAILDKFFIDRDISFHKWEIGKKWFEEYNVSNPLILLPKKSPNGFFYRRTRTETKFVRYTITKTDSVTLTVNLFEKFNLRGFKKFGIKKLDTTFQVKYSSSYFETSFSNINYINCDRFILYPNLTEFYVKIPKFNGAKLLVYFKTINAYMPAVYYKGRYVISKVPSDEEVVLVATGKKGNSFYVGKEEYTISKKSNIDLEMKTVSYDEMKDMFSTIGKKK